MNIKAKVGKVLATRLPKVVQKITGAGLAGVVTVFCFQPNGEVLKQVSPPLALGAASVIIETFAHRKQNREIFNNLKNTDAEKIEIISMAIPTVQ